MKRLMGHWALRVCVSLTNANVDTLTLKAMTLLDERPSGVTTSSVKVYTLRQVGRSKEQLSGVHSYFHHVGSGIERQLLRLVAKAFALLNHLVAPQPHF